MGYVRTTLAYGRAIRVQDDAMLLSLRKPDENVNELSKKKTACACRQFLWRNPCIQCVNNCLGRLGYTDVNIPYDMPLACHSSVARVTPAVAAAAAAAAVSYTHLTLPTKRIV